MKETYRKVLDAQLVLERNPGDQPTNPTRPQLSPRPTSELGNAPSADDHNLLGYFGHGETLGNQKKRWKGPRKFDSKMRRPGQAAGSTQRSLSDANAVLT